MATITTTRPTEFWRNRPDAAFYDLGDANAVAIAHTLLQEAKEKHEPVKIVTGSKEEALFMEILPELSATASATDVKVIYVGEASPALAKMIANEPIADMVQFADVGGEGTRALYYWLVGDDALRLKRDPDAAVAVSFLDNDVIGRELALDFAEREKQVRKSRL